MELSCHRHAGRRLAVLGMFSVTDLVVGMGLLAAHQLLRGSLLGLVVIVAAWIGWVAVLRRAARRGLDVHLALACVTPRSWRSLPRRR